jgi:hypothetical protein
VNRQGIAFIILSDASPPPSQRVQIHVRSVRRPDVVGLGGETVRAGQHVFTIIEFPNELYEYRDVSTGK